MCHDSVVVVGREGIVPGEGDHGLGRVIPAVPSLWGLPGGVGVVRIGHVTEQLEVAEPELGDGAVAAAWAAALQHVGGAGGDLLGRQVQQLAGADLGVRLDLDN